MSKSIIEEAKAIQVNDFPLTEEQVNNILEKTWFVDSENPEMVYVPLGDEYQTADESVAEALVQAEHNGHTLSDDLIKAVYDSTGVTLETVSDALKRYEPQTGLFYTA